MNHSLSTLTQRQQWLAFALLAALMLLTRTDVYLLGNLVPDASWGIFVLAGLLLGSLAYLAAFGLLAWGIDIWVTHAAGNPEIAAYCLTPAYLAMPLAWASLWAAGRWIRRSHGALIQPASGFALLAGISVAFLISNLGFYLGSGHFTDMAASEFASRVMGYYPWYLATTLGWFGAGTLATWLTLATGERSAHDLA
jgi:hypothetical protein